MQLLGILCFAVSSVVFGQTYTISTFAGGGPPDNYPGLSLSVGNGAGVASDAAGNVFLISGNSVFRMDAVTGRVTRIAGTGISGFGGDGGPATSAQLRNVGGLAVDTAGSVYIVDSGNSRVRKVSNGVINTVAGGGSTFPGDNGPATSASLGLVADSLIAVDSGGNLYIAETSNDRIRRVSSGVITTIAGSGAGGAGGFSGDNGPATSAQLAHPTGVAVDAAGNVYIADSGNYRVREVSNGIISTLVGMSTGGLDGEGIPASSAFVSPQGIAVDSAGTLYISDWIQPDNPPSQPGHSRIRTVANGVITTFAGNGQFGFSGDGGPATLARVANPEGLALDSAGDLYVLDQFGTRIRKVSGGIITTVAGNGSNISGDGGPPTDARLNSPTGVAVDSAGDLYIAGPTDGRIRKVSNGVITTVAGDGTTPISRDGIPAIDAVLNSPQAVALDAANNLYIMDVGSDRILRVSNGAIFDAAGNGTNYINGGVDNIPATQAFVNPVGLAVGSDGTVYISDIGYNGPSPLGGGFSAFPPGDTLVRKVQNGVITTVAGNIISGSDLDNIPALNAHISAGGLAVDSGGNLYIVAGQTRVREVSNGVITTVVGNGKFGSNGDGGPAISANGLFTSIAIDSAGSLYLADVAGQRIRKVSNGVINTIAGNGTNGFSGDNGPALSAQLDIELTNLSTIAVDSAGRVYIADPVNLRVRVLTPNLPFPAQNSASYAAGPVAPDTIAISQVSGIAPAPLTAPTGAWPTSLGSVSLQITDSQNVKQFAPIGSISPTSVTYLIPATTALGPASVQLTTSTGAVIAGQIQINRIAPGLFSANSSGSGVAAGMWMRDTAIENTQTSGYLFDPTLPVGQRYAIGFDPGPESDQVFLSLYGTGFHNANVVTATVGGASVPVTGIAPMGSSAGEDVVTIGPLPRSLEGANIPIVLTFDGQQANAVTFSMQPTRSRPTGRTVR